MINRLPFITLILIWIVICFSACHQGTSLTHREIMSKASRTEKNGWILIHVEGSPAVIRYQHGYLLAGEIVDLKSAFFHAGAEMVSD